MRRHHHTFVCIRPRRRPPSRDIREASRDRFAAQVDTVRYGVAGWKDRYYQSKLGLPRGDPSARAVVVGHYVKGLCWVLMYYYQGVQVRYSQATPSVLPVEARVPRPMTRAHAPFAQDWGWYYPYHYAPCASDLVNLSEFAGGQFEIGSPFSPFEQLMAVFPPASSHALPKSYAEMMVDARSPIIDFYPIDFRNDLNGKKFSWQARDSPPRSAAEIGRQIWSARLTAPPSPHGNPPSTCARRSRCCHSSMRRVCAPRSRRCARTSPTAKSRATRTETTCSSPRATRPAHPSRRRSASAAV